MKVTRETAQIGTSIIYTNDLGASFSGTIVKVTDKSAWISYGPGTGSPSRHSWNRLKKYSIYENTTGLH